MGNDTTYYLYIVYYENIINNKKSPELIKHKALFFFPSGIGHIWVVMKHPVSFQLYS